MADFFQAHFSPNGIASLRCLVAVEWEKFIALTT